MGEGSDYEETTYEPAHDFSQARQHFDQHAGRSYDEAKKTGKTNADFLPKMIKSTARFLLALIGDVTGSMGDAPGVYFAKQPYVLHEVKTEYMGEDTDMLFGAFGDANPPDPDEYSLQFRPPFKVTLDMAQAKKEIMKLITTEHGGGGQKMENAELAALYLLRNVSAPHAELKIGIIITDEAPYDYADKSLSDRIAYVKLDKDMPTAQIFDGLKADGWNIYVIQRPYSNSHLGFENMDYVTAQVHRKWVDILGDDHVAYLPDIDRVVDVIFGILGDATDMYEYFMTEIADRQLKDKNGQNKIDAAFKALRSIHLKHMKTKKKEADEVGASKLHVELGGKPGKKLL